MSILALELPEKLSINAFPPTQGMQVDIPEHIAQIERRLERAGKTVGDMCDGAEIARSTWTRWKAGKTEPNLRTWNRLLDVVSEFEAANGEPCDDAGREAAA